MRMLGIEITNISLRNVLPGGDIPTLKELLDEFPYVTSVSFTGGVFNKDNLGRFSHARYIKALVVSLHCSVSFSVFPRHLETICVFAPTPTSCLSVTELFRQTKPPRGNIELFFYMLNNIYQWEALALPPYVTRVKVDQRRHLAAPFNEALHTLGFRRVDRTEHVCVFDREEPPGRPVV